MNERGPGHWRFENSLLEDAEFKKKMISNINTSKEDELTDPNMRWKWIKFKIRLFSIEFRPAKRRECRKEINDLQDRLQSLIEQEDLHGSPDNVEEIHSIKRELKEITYRSQ